MLFSTEFVLAACIGAAMAGPTHLHRHRDVHAKKDLSDVDWSKLDWDDMGIDWASAWSAGQTTQTSTVPAATASPTIAVAKPAVTTSAAAVVASTTSSTAAASSTTAASIISDVKTLFSTLVGMANLRTSFGQATAVTGSEVAQIGNMGSPQGSNMMLVDSIEGYDFTNTFKNTQSVPITVIIWNKAAYTGTDPSAAEANLGSCIALETPALSFSLAPGASQSVAFMDETQCGWAQATSNKTPAGAADTTWGEANFVTGGSGFDVSSIVNSKGNTYDMAISAAEVSCKSDTTQNDWIANGGNPEDPIPIGDSNGSCYVPGPTMTLETTMGGDF